MTKENFDSDNPTTKFYYIEFVGLVDQEIDAAGLFGQQGSNDGEDWKAGLSSENPLESMMPKKFKIPQGDNFSTIMKTDFGFVPSAITKHLKSQFRVEKIIINFVKELTKDEYEAELNFKAMDKVNKFKVTTEEQELKKRLENGTASAAEKSRVNHLPYKINDEIENLIGSVESGRLHVVAPDADEPEYVPEPTDEDLVNSTFKFDDEDEDEN